MLADFPTSSRILTKVAQCRRSSQQEKLGCGVELQYCSIVSFRKPSRWFGLLPDFKCQTWRFAFFAMYWV